MRKAADKGQRLPDFTVSWGDPTINYGVVA
jgi:hypothetical protein